MKIAQAGISVVTSEGEKTLTNQNAQMIKTQMNAEKEAMKRGSATGDAQQFVNEATPADMEGDFGAQGDSQPNAISTSHY